MSRLTIRLHPDDEVVVARVEMLPGTPAADEGVTAQDRIPAGHKLAVRQLQRGQPVHKFGQVIGVAAEDIAPGAHVHVHNLEMGDSGQRHAAGSNPAPVEPLPVAERATFEGFVRANGRVGTRNYIGILTSVNCSATVAKGIAQTLNRDGIPGHPNVDGVVALVHAGGCGMADSGDGYENLQRTLWGFTRHPNFAGVLMVGLGCEVNQIDFLLDAYGIQRGPAFRTMTIQGEGGTRRTVQRGVDIIREMLPDADQARRTTVDASHLTLALQCGGSDAYSGVSANPALGVAADLLVRQGGTAVLSETPEIYGAEHLLTDRAVSETVAGKLRARIAWWEDYVARNHGHMNNNPSPGNKAGGLTTILEKSLGAVAKGGTTPLVDVYRYAEPIRERGLVFMDSPGFDPCSVTGQAASGANVVCFTTGRGSVFGCKPVPSVKLASNSPMYRRMDDDMDINCGAVVDGDASVAEMGRQIFETVLEVASGTRTRSEVHGLGDNEYIPWQVGAVM